MLRSINIFKPQGTKFLSTFHPAKQIVFPNYTNTRVMMMPVRLGELDSLPCSLNHYKPLVHSAFKETPKEFIGRIGYLTIDESKVTKGETQRRAGLHVDGVYQNKAGGWGGGGVWGAGGDNIQELLTRPIDLSNKYQYGPGMFIAASLTGCAAWNQVFEGIPGSNGECDHLLSQCKEEHKKILQPNLIYWLNPLCVHAATEMPKDSNRQFFRLSMPSNAPWFDEYTPNPLGIKPTGPIVSEKRQEFMNFRA